MQLNRIRVYSRTWAPTTTIMIRDGARDASRLEPLPMVRFSLCRTNLYLQMNRLLVVTVRPLGHHNDTRRSNANHDDGPLKRWFFIIAFFMPRHHHQKRPEKSTTLTSLGPQLSFLFFPIILFTNKILL